MAAAGGLVATVTIVSHPAIEVVSIHHLASDSCVVPQIEILTYLRVRSVFNLQDALLSNAI